jgi:hypothetical protein
MSKLKLVMLMMIIATLACLGSGGEDIEGTATDTPALDATSTKVAGSLQKEPTPTSSAEPQEKPTAVPELTETPAPTTQTEEPGETPTIMSPGGIAYEEIFFPVQYVIENDLDMEIIDFRVLRTDFKSDTLLGVMKNTGNSVLADPSVYIGAIDDSGEVIEVEYAHQFTYTIYPGEKSSFSASFLFGIPEETVEIVIGVEIREETEEMYMRVHDYEIITSDIMSLTDGKQIVSVRFRNNSEYSTKGHDVEITFLDRNNKIIGCGNGFLEYSTVVPSGGEAEIDFQVHRLLGDYESYELLIEGAIAEE